MLHRHTNDMILTSAASREDRIAYHRTMIPPPSSPLDEGQPSIVDTNNTNATSASSSSTFFSSSPQGQQQVQRRRPPPPPPPSPPQIPTQEDTTPLQPWSEASDDGNGGNPLPMHRHSEQRRTRHRRHSTSHGEEEDQWRGGMDTHASSSCVALDPHAHPNRSSSSSSSHHRVLPSSLPSSSSPVSLLASSPLPFYRSSFIEPIDYGVSMSPSQPPPALTTGTSLQFSSSSLSPPSAPRVSPSLARRSYSPPASLHATARVGHTEGAGEEIMGTRGERAVTTPTLATASPSVCAGGLSSFSPSRYDYSRDCTLASQHREMAYLVHQMSSLNARWLYRETQRIQRDLAHRRKALHRRRSDTRRRIADQIRQGQRRRRRGPEDEEVEEEEMDMARDVEMLQHLLCYLQHFLSCSTEWLSRVTDDRREQAIRDAPDAAADAGEREREEWRRPRGAASQNRVVLDGEKSRMDKKREQSIIQCGAGSNSRHHHHDHDHDHHRHRHPHYRCVGSPQNEGPTSTSTTRTRTRTRTPIISTPPPPPPQEEEEGEGEEQLPQHPVDYDYYSTGAASTMTTCGFSSPPSWKMTKPSKKSTTTTATTATRVHAATPLSIRSPSCSSCSSSTVAAAAAEVAGGNERDDGLTTATLPPTATPPQRLLLPPPRSLLETIAEALDQRRMEAEQMRRRGVAATPPTTGIRGGEGGTAMRSPLIFITSGVYHESLLLEPSAVTATTFARAADAADSVAARHDDPSPAPRYPIPRGVALDPSTPKPSLSSSSSAADGGGGGDELEKDAAVLLELAAGPAPGSPVLLYRRRRDQPILHIRGQGCVVRLRGIVFVDDGGESEEESEEESDEMSARDTGTITTPPGARQRVSLPMLYCSDGARVECEGCHFYGHPHPSPSPAPLLLLTSSQSGRRSTMSIPAATKAITSGCRDGADKRVGCPPFFAVEGVGRGGIRGEVVHMHMDPCSCCCCTRAAQSSSSSKPSLSAAAAALKTKQSSSSLAAALVQCEGSGAWLSLRLCLFSFCHRSRQEAVWVGGGGARLQLHDTKIRHCRCGVRVRPGGILEAMVDCTVTQCEEAGVVVERDAAAWLKRCGIRHHQCRRGTRVLRGKRTSGTGVQLLAGGRLDMSDSAVECNAGYGVLREEGAYLHLHKTFVRENAGGNVVTTAMGDVGWGCR